MKNSRLPHPRFFVAALLTLLTLITACSAPSADLLDGPIVAEMTEGQKSGGQVFDHSAFDALLSAHVDAQAGRVNYAGLKADRAKLDAYLQTIAKARMQDLGADEQHALLINAYNGYTLKLIVENYPVGSIRDLSDPWGSARYEVASHTLSLDNIEHNLIRPIFKDPRIHFAVNCAAKDCPPLRATAYTGEALDAQLEEASRAVLGSPRFVRVEGDKLRVTKLFDWYGDDFTNNDFKGSASNVARYVARYSSDSVRAFIEAKNNDPTVDFLDYDWSLNDSGK
ncbi:MAG: DUF547 domain-containing protein [Bradymonadaceae bacterium]|nr:DUF547 domain-containing protein [Lujinxingiaceae bacterium]